MLCMGMNGILVREFEGQISPTNRIRFLRSPALWAGLFTLDIAGKIVNGRAVSKLALDCCGGIGCNVPTDLDAGDFVNIFGRHISRRSCPSNGKSG